MAQEAKAVELIYEVGGGHGVSVGVGVVGDTWVGRRRVEKGGSVVEIEALAGRECVMEVGLERVREAKCCRSSTRSSLPSICKASSTLR